LTHRTRQNAFTLLELLTALALIAGLLAAIYGAYLAATDSTRRGQAHLNDARQARTTLAALARQCRSAYLPPAPTPSSGGPASLAPGFTLPVSSDGCASSAAFRAGDLPRGRILEILTTASRFTAQPDDPGLFHVAYRLDPAVGILYYCQQPYAPGRDLPPDASWLPLAQRVAAFQVSCFDGRNWQLAWDSTPRGLPRAVRLEITLGRRHTAPDAQGPGFFATTACLATASAALPQEPTP